MREPNESSIEQRERGRNVLLSLKVIRHGERDLAGHLTDYGRDVTRERTKEARRQGSAPEDLTGIKAIGSTAGPAGPGGMQRAMETAHIYAEEVAQRENTPQYETRERSALNFQKFQEKEPFNWPVFYNERAESASREQYRKPFDQLSNEQKVEIAQMAQTACINRLFRDKVSDAFVKDVASNFAFLTDRYIRMADRLKNDSRVLYVGGTHGGLIEPFLREVLLRRTADGKTIQGFEDINEIGGAFRPSEAFTVNIETRTYLTESASITA